VNTKSCKVTVFTILLLLSIERSKW